MKRIDDDPFEPEPGAGIPITTGGGEEEYMDSYYDENGNPISTPQRVTKAEFYRRADLRGKNYLNGFDPNFGKITEQAAPAGPAPAGRPNYGKAPMFSAPGFQWGEQWQAPSIDEALNDPGYQFRANEGRRALEQSAAARGLLGSGGTLKDINSWGQNFAKQEYGDVFNRKLTGYNTRFNTEKDKFDRFYTGKKDEFAPKLFEWQTNAHGADLGFAKNWENYFRNNLSAQDIWNKSY